MLNLIIELGIWKSVGPHTSEKIHCIVLHRNHIFQNLYVQNLFTLSEGGEQGGGEPEASTSHIRLSPVFLRICP